MHALIVLVFESTQNKTNEKNFNVKHIQNVPSHSQQEICVMKYVQFWTTQNWKTICSLLIFLWMSFGVTALAQTIIYILSVVMDWFLVVVIFTWVSNLYSRVSWLQQGVVAIGVWGFMVALCWFLSILVALSDFLLSYVLLLLLLSIKSFLCHYIFYD